MPSIARTFALVGHRSSGKTTLAEAMLCRTGVVRTPGRIADGSTLLDYDPEERDRQEGAFASSAWMPWGESTLFMIDTPGGDAAVVSSRVAADAADLDVIVVDGTDGIESGTERALDWARQWHRPAIIVITRGQCLSENALHEVADGASLRVGRRSLIVPVPVTGDRSSYLSRESLDDDAARSFIEQVAMEDDAILERCLDGLAVDGDMLRRALARGTQSCALLPVLVVDSVQERGIEALLDMLAVVTPAPSPAQGPLKLLHAYSSFSNDNALISVFRVVRGQLTFGAKLEDRQGQSHTVSRWYHVRGPRRASARILGPGALVATWEPVATKPGEYLWARGHVEDLPQRVVLPPLAWADLRVVEKRNTQKLMQAIAALQAIDPSLSCTSTSSGLLLAAHAPAGIERVALRLRTRWSLTPTIAPPPVQYFEQPQADVMRQDGQVREDLGGGILGYCALSLDMTRCDVAMPSRVIFSVDDDALPAKFHDAVQRGVDSALRHGPLAGYPVRGLQICVVDADYDIFGTQERHVESAAASAVHRGLRTVNSQLLAPWVLLRLRIFGHDVGPYLAEINQRGGRIEGMEMDEDGSILLAQCAQAQMPALGAKFHSLSHGRARLDVQARHYAAVDADESAKIVQQSSAHTQSDVLPFSNLARG